MSKNTHCTLYVEGMHCPSCELLIEKKLLKKENVKAVDASLGSGKVEIELEDSDKLNINELNEEFEKYNYKFSTKKVKGYSKPFISFQGGQMQINPKKSKSFFTSVLVFFGLIVAFFAFESLKLGQYVSVDSSSSLPTFFVLGLVAGVSSCAALVGGLLLSLVKNWNEQYIDSESNIQKLQPHIMFHIGRIFSFLVLGGILGFIGQAISEAFDLTNTSLFSFLTIAVSILMFVLAMQMLNVPGFRKIRFGAPKSMTRSIANEDSFGGRFLPFVIGGLTFFLPCGFTLIAQSLALTSASVLSGALIMMFFALGTFIPLAFISFSGVALNSKPHLTAKFNMVAGLLIVFFALYNINGQINVLGLPSLNDIGMLFESRPADENIEYAALNTKGQQQLNFIAEGFDYTPTSSVYLRSGQPAVLVVDNKGILGCGSQMAAAGLIDGYYNLKKGINTIDLGSPRRGTYKLTCSMGMVSPVNIYVI